MDWSEVASVDLPQGTQSEDLLGVVDQLEAQVKAATATERPAGVPAIKALEATVEEALEALVDARDILRKLQAQRVASTPVTDDDNNVANTNADDAWRSVERFLDGKRVLPDRAKPGRKEAARLYATLFEGDRDGLKFINTRPRRQWATATELLEELEKPAHVQLMKELGGERELKAVQRTHREFGVAFRFLKAQELAPDTVTDTRPAQAALQSALRNYLLKVTARVSKRDPQSAVVARYLLQPYTDMVEDVSKTSRGRKTAASAPQATGATAPPPA